jgi:hypothetical protein
MKIISPVSVPRTSCYGRLPIQIKTPSQQTQQIPLENKVKIIIAPKVTNDGPPFFQKRKSILCYHNIKDFDASLAND